MILIHVYNPTQVSEVLGKSIPLYLPGQDTAGSDGLRESSSILLFSDINGTYLSLRCAETELMIEI